MKQKIKQVGLGALIALGILMTPKTSQAQVFELGGGTLSDSNGVQALVRVRTNFIDHGFILLRITGDIAFGKSGVGFTDIQVRSLGFNEATENSFWGMTFVNTRITRDVQIGEGLTTSFHLIGLQMGRRDELTPELALILNASLDLLGYTASSPIEAGLGNNKFDGFSYGRVWLETGLDISKTFRISVGARAELASTSTMAGYCQSSSSGGGGWYDDGDDYYYDDDYYDDWDYDDGSDGGGGSGGGSGGGGGGSGGGGYYDGGLGKRGAYSVNSDPPVVESTHCREVANSTFFKGQAYLGVSYRISQALSLFGVLSYNVYEFNSAVKEEAYRNSVPESRMNKGWNLRFGASVKM